MNTTPEELARRSNLDKMRAEAQQRIEAAKVEYAQKYLPGLPTQVTDLVWRKAWDDGHASGYHEVEQQYEEIAEIVNATYACCPSAP